MRWLGLDWDEGPEVGGDHGPYRQSERTALYDDVAARLLESGHAYHAYDSPEELEERREQARAAGGHSGYDGLHRDLTAEQKAAYEAEGRRPVLRFRMPDEAVTFTDLVRGDIVFEPGSVPDPVLVRANGQPLYTLTNPVDDATMGITHVLRGEDLLSSTPRQLPLHRALIALGIGEGVLPEFGHLPFVMGPSNRKLSKRDPAVGLASYRERGFLPEGLLNYLALLGWSIGGDRELFDLDEMAAAFDVRRVNPNSAQFDLKKAEAINGLKIRGLAPDDLARRLVPYLQSAGLLGDPVDAAHRALLEAATPLVQERVAVLSEAVDMLAFLFVDEADFSVDADDAAKAFTEQGLDGGARRAGRPCRPGRLADRGHRVRAARRPGRGARDQAQAGVRAGAGRGHRTPDLTAAVRVAGAARARPVAGATGRGARLTGRLGRAERAPVESATGSAPERSA